MFSISYSSHKSQFLQEDLQLCHLTVLSQFHALGCRQCESLSHSVAVQSPFQCRGNVADAPVANMQLSV